MFVTTGSPTVGLTVSTNVCKLASLCCNGTVTLSCVHTHSLSIHANTHFLHVFFKETNKTPLDYRGTMGESRSPRQRAEREWSLYVGQRGDWGTGFGLVGGVAGAAVAFD